MTSCWVDDCRLGRKLWQPTSLLWTGFSSGPSADINYIYFCLCWIPSHIGIKGNERGDQAAKAALGFSISDVKCPPTDLYHELADHCQRLWQSRWDICTSNKLHSIKPSIGNCSLNHLSRQDSAVIRRLQIGHMRLTHSYLFNKEDQPQCSFCDCKLTVVHFLIECPTMMSSGGDIFPLPVSRNCLILWECVMLLLLLETFLCIIHRI